MLDETATVSVISVGLKADERRALDEWRKRQDNPPSRPRAVRELLREALTRNSVGLSGREPRHV